MLSLDATLLLVTPVDAAPVDALYHLAVGAAGLLDLGLKESVPWRTTAAGKGTVHALIALKPPAVDQQQRQLYEDELDVRIAVRAAADVAGGAAGSAVRSVVPVMPSAVTALPPAPRSPVRSQRVASPLSPTSPANEPEERPSEWDTSVRRQHLLLPETASSETLMQMGRTILDSARLPPEEPSASHGNAPLPPEEQSAAVAARGTVDQVVELELTAEDRQNYERRRGQAIADVMAMGRPASVPVQPQQTRQEAPVEVQPQHTRQEVARRVARPESWRGRGPGPDGPQGSAHG